MTGISQRELVMASLACTHHPDVYLSRGTNARPALSVEWPPESKRGEARSTGRDGGLPAPTRLCECGHATGDHHGVRRGPLHPVLLGRCLVNGCDCDVFTENVTPLPVPGTDHRRHR